jgi:hypothetical protein
VVFGENVDVVVNRLLGRRGFMDYFHSSKMGGEVLLPPFGFVIESATFVAFHASSWNDVKHDKPVLFTIRSLDGKPIEESKKIRVFHGFGSQKLKLRGETRSVPREETFEF